MRRRSCLQLGSVFVSLALSPARKVCAANATSRQPLPLNYFARRPLLEQVIVSPDGKLIAAITNNNNESVIVTRPVGGDTFTELVGSNNLEYSINWIHWVNNERLVFSASYPSNRDPGLIGRFNTTESRLHAINADGSGLLNLIKTRGAGAKDLYWAIKQDNVIDWLPEDGQHILLTLPSSVRHIEPSVFKVNVYTAERSTYGDAKEWVFDWMTDQAHKVRIGIGSTESGERTVWVCDPSGKNWRLLNKASFFDAGYWYPMGFGLDPNILYVNGLSDGLASVFTLDLRQAEAEPTLKLSHPRYELRGRLIHDRKGEAIGIRVSALGDSSAFYWDDRYKQLQKRIDASLPGRFNEVYSNSHDEKTHVLISDEPGRPAQTYLVLLDEDLKLRKLAESYPELNGQALGQRRSIQVKARDGLELHGYLTWPPGLEASPLSRIPLIVLPHGGPQAADGPEFDSWAAFLADRGYLVMQLNFRGSSGYGRKHLEAGWRRWGLEMQEDLEDGVADLVKRGWADPRRVGIVGASYGGYAALMGLVKTPHLYRCGFAFAPVTDLYDWAEEHGRRTQRETMARLVGDYRTERQRLLDVSPCMQASKIKSPVMLIHGTHDRQVEYQHSKKMAEALASANKTYEFITQQRGDHHLSHFAYRQQLLMALEDFLARHMGASESGAESRLDHSVASR